MPIVMSITNRRRFEGSVQQASPSVLAGSTGTAFMRGFGQVTDGLPEYTTWNPLDKSGNIDLTSGDLIATANSGATGAVRAVAGKTAGKWYCEIKNNNISLNNNSGVALVAVTTPLANIIAATTDALALLGTGSLFMDEVFQTTMGSVVNKTISFAYDADNHLAWIRVDDGDWNDDPSAYPEDAANGYDVSGFDGAGLYPACGTGATGHTWTANFGALPFQYIKPYGFFGWLA